jgi:LmbE family N-acetylglucosaminyl deacetylase
MHKKLTRLLLTSAALGSLCLSFSLSAHAQVDAVYDQGSSALIRMLERLQTTASVLHTGAHPDDEDSALVAYHARRMNARTAYLSLTRGSGGQNIIGAEQSDALGVIRTEELLQARRLDGASQYFTRANDFGFSKTRTEASRIWPENELLADMVRIIREFRPDVVVSRWNGTGSDGHGHHQFTGYLTPLAVSAAADSSRFTDQIDAGLQPWRVQKLYVSLRSDPVDSNAHTLDINTGEYDPLTGRSYFQIGMQGRSQQKTQQMGSLELQGTQLSVLQLTASNIAINSGERSVFDGIDTSISGLIRFEPQPASVFIDLSGELQSMITGILNNFNPLEPAASIAKLAEAHKIANRTKDAAHNAETIRLLEEKIMEIESALVLAAGVRVDALTDAEMLVPGTTANIALKAYVPSENVSLKSAHITAPAGWRVSAADIELLPNETGLIRIERPKEQAFFQVAIPEEASVTQPYWLERTREGAAYDWSTAGAAQTLPFAAPLITAEVVFDIAGVTTAVYKDVEYRQLDRIRGEVRRRIDIVPAVSVEPATDLLVIPESASAQPIQLLLTVRNNSQNSIEGSAQFALPPGWNLEPAFTEFALPPAPASSTLVFEVSMPANVRAGEYRLIGSALVGGKLYQRAVQEIAYPHIRTHRIYAESETEVEVVDVEVADVQVDMSWAVVTLCRPLCADWASKSQSCLMTS